MRKFWRNGCVLLVWAALAAGCGVGPEAGTLARREAALLEVLPETDEEIRAALLRQGEAWNSLAVHLERKRLGGMPVGADFREVVTEAGQLSRRLRVLIETGEDEPWGNRESLMRLRGLWRGAAEYLKP